MKNTIRLTFLFLVACLTGCASTRCYVADRGHDALDVMTVTVGMGAGAQARLGPLPLGVLQVSDVAGVRYGGTFCRLPTTEEPEELNSTMLALGCTLLWPACALVGLSNEGNARYWEGVSRLCYYHNHFPMNEVQFRRNKGTDSFGLPTCCQVEAVVGVGGTFRLGFNPGELLDLILGWTTIDIFDDDLEWKKRKSNQSVESD